MRLLAATSIVAMMPMSALAHTADQQDAWFDDWNHRLDMVGALTPDLLDDYFDFRDRHQVIYLEPQARNIPDRVERWRSLVAAYFPASQVERAMCVMSLESGGNPDAANPTSSARGLFQHLGRYWSDRSTRAGWAGASIFDPEANVAVAAWLQSWGGWGHWTVSPQC